jgi:acid phosphatase
MPPPTIILRSPADETLFPNDASCRRFAQLSRAFAARASQRWNDSDEMNYISGKIGKWMPGDYKKVAVDGRPRLSGVMDTINASRGHPGKETKLPKEFYDPKMNGYIEKIAVEEWFKGYEESKEYRMLGIGGLMGDVVGRMVGSTGQTGGKGVTFGLSGCHDTTVAGALTSLGAFQGESWPPFTSHVAFELFKKQNLNTDLSRSGDTGKSKTTWPSWLTGGSKATEKSGSGWERCPLEDMPETQRQSLDGYFVRVRYNDKIMKVPGCKAMGKHLEGDESLCTLVSADLD